MVPNYAVSLICINIINIYPPPISVRKLTKVNVSNYKGVVKL